MAATIKTSKAEIKSDRYPSKWEQFFIMIAVVSGWVVRRLEKGEDGQLLEKCPNLGLKLAHIRQADG